MATSRISSRVRAASRRRTGGASTAAGRAIRLLPFEDRGHLRMRGLRLAVRDITYQSVQRQPRSPEDPLRSRHLVGLIGADIGPSLTPPLHEREADRLGLPYFYERIAIAALGLAPERGGGLVGAAGQLGYSGLNVTHPCKQLVVEHLDALSSDAETLGAVNTVVFDAGRAVGHNTDWPAFQRSFVRGLGDVATGRIVLVGAGGAGAAVGHAALSLGAGRVAVVD